MARLVRSRIEARSARLRLPARKEPYWAVLEQGLAIGYYRPLGGGAGSWWGRVRINGRYLVEAIATANDHVDADGVTLSWGPAQEAVRVWARRQAQAGPATIAGAAAQYLDDLKARKGARPAYEASLSLNKHLLPVLGAVRLINLTDQMIRGWRNGLVAESADPEEVRRSRDTANRVLGITRAVLNFAYRGGLVADDRAWRRVEPFRGVGQSRKVILDDAQIQRLIDCCDPGLRELVALGAWTGARLGELTSCRVNDFDAAGGTLAVDGKTGPRTIFLPPAAILLLRRLAAGKRPDAYLLTTASGKQWIENRHHLPFIAAAAKAGLPVGTTYYSLRHSYISRALRQLVPVKAIADSCGTSMRMIEQTYGKFMVADRRRYAEIAAPDLNLDVDVEVIALRAVR